MSHPIRLQFDPNQPHQLEAVENVVRLFEGLSRYSVQFTLGDEVVANLPPDEELSTIWLAGNLGSVQRASDLPTNPFDQITMDSSLPLEGFGNETIRFPSFTVEMETGTGKTYVYLRTIYELHKYYGFSKFIVVVPSIAIYEGVIKNFQITQNHFRALYSNETVNLIQYDGSRLSQLRAFAASTFVEVMVITLDSFNKSSNVIFKPSEKLPGERLPYQFIQETRPILILDEPQNMESEKAKQALATLRPLFALRYSATHRSSPNQIYDLSPFDAYRLNLVKKIQVLGVTERENFNKPFMALQDVTLESGRAGRSGIKARLKTYVTDQGHTHEADVILHHGDDLYIKTRREEHRAGYKVAEINAAGNYVEFENGERLDLSQSIGSTHHDLFRVQIQKTLEEHMKRQQELERKGIKVLSLFFIDRVANYTASDGVIRRIFDEEFERLKVRYPFYEKLSAEDVRQAYFAKKKTKEGEEAIDTESRNQAEREAEKAAFVLIMKDKERLLSFDEKTCFIFAHSALKEGWDNPNVFQICTLNQTVSEVKKRQEIGRGLRLAVNQQGERVFDDDINLLTVVANESYQSYAATLQSEYRETGDAAPPPPRDASKRPAQRNDQVFNAQAFRDFWAKLQRRTTYQIQVDSPALIQTCVERINNKPTPQAVIVVEKAKYVMTEFSLRLESVTGKRCRIQVSRRDTEGEESVFTNTFTEKADLAELLHEERLRGFKIIIIQDQASEPSVTFSNGVTLYLHTPKVFQSELGQKPSEKASLAPQDTYPVPNLIDRAARETGLTRPTINQIFKSLSDRKKRSIFANPEGFAGQFIGEINNALADHVAERIQFKVDPDSLDWGYDLDDLFPPHKIFPQKELIASDSAGIYDQTQIDSEVEKRFVMNRLIDNDQVVFYFKFPPSFKIHLPKVIGNYNPDWGIAHYGSDGKIILELVRETKGSEELEGLQFPHEKRKILCARKHFKEIGIDYRVVSDQVANWWQPGEDTYVQGGLESS